MKDFHWSSANGDCGGIAVQPNVSNSNAIADRCYAMTMLHAQSLISI
jgi:hypothetical protein